MLLPLPSETNTKCLSLCAWSSTSKALLQAQRENWQVFQSLIASSGTLTAVPTVATSFPHVSFTKKGASKQSEGLLETL